MAPPEKPSRLGRGLDALLARRDSQKPNPPAAATPAPSGTPSAPANTPATGAEPLYDGGGSPANAGQQTAPSSADNTATIVGATAGSGAAASSARATSGTASSDHSSDPVRADPLRHDPQLRSPAMGAPTTGAHASGAPATGTPATRDTAARDVTARTDPHTPGYRPLPIAHIAPNPFQPRKEFHPQELADLESSLRSQGLLQPITVRPSPNHAGYELIAGERRLRSAKNLGWTEIPAIVRETDDRTMLTLAMVENLQRADLDPIEEADGYQRLIDEFDATQQEVADVVGKERSTVANALRLLALPASVKRMLQERKISVGHARALLPLETERAMADLARDIVASSLSVRDVEKRVRSTRPSPAKSGRKAKPADTGVSAGSPAASAELRRVEELLRKKMQTTVNVHLTGKERGEVRIAFFSNDDLERVLELLGVRLDN